MKSFFLEKKKGNFLAKKGDVGKKFSVNDSRMYQLSSCLKIIHFLQRICFFFQQGEKEKGSLAIYYEFFAQTALFFYKTFAVFFFKEKHFQFFSKDLL